MKCSELKTERKGAAPFSLAAVLALEEVFSMKWVPLGYLLLAGFFLAWGWGSLRFSDAACCSPKFLSMEGWILRGSAWKTKLSSRGTPSSVTGACLLGRFPCGVWAHNRMCALSKWVSQVPGSEREGIDFSFLTSQLTEARSQRRPCPTQQQS